MHIDSVIVDVFNKSECAATSMPRTCQDAAPSQYAMHLPVCHASMPRTLQYATHRNPRGFEATEDTGLYRHVRSHEVLGVSPPEVTGFWESHFQEVRGRQSEVPRSPEFRGPPKPRCLRSFIFKGFFPAHWQTVRGSHVSRRFIVTIRGGASKGCRRRVLCAGVWRAFVFARRIPLSLPCHCLLHRRPLHPPASHCLPPQKGCEVACQSLGCWRGCRQACNLAGAPAWVPLPPPVVCGCFQTSWTKLGERETQAPKSVHPDSELYTLTRSSKAAAPECILYTRARLGALYTRARLGTWGTRPALRRVSARSLILASAFLPPPCRFAALAAGLAAAAGSDGGGTEVECARPLTLPPKFVRPLCPARVLIGYRPSCRSPCVGHAPLVCRCTQRDCSAEQV